MKVRVDSGDNHIWLLEYDKYDEKDNMPYVEIPDDIWSGYMHHVKAVHVWGQYLRALLNDQNKRSKVVRNDDDVEYLRNQPVAR